MDLIYSGKVQIVKSEKIDFNPLDLTRSAELLQIHPTLKQELDSWLCSHMDDTVKVESEETEKNVDRISTAELETLKLLKQNQAMNETIEEVNNLFKFKPIFL